MHHTILCILFLYLSILNTIVHSKTKSEDVSALNVMFSSLNSGSQLTGWKQNGGDPCDESWEGITCSGSDVTQIELSGLGLSGSVGYQLSNMKSVKKFDLSQNKLQGDIPYQLPPNLKYLDLSNNQLTGNLPYSISQMGSLEYLYLGQNKLQGQLTDMFQQLSHLKILDLSENSLSGELPRSFAYLTSLKKLELNDNNFTGTIKVLTDLPLDELDVEDNGFTGSIPKKLEKIDSLRTGGNQWSSGSETDSESEGKTGKGNGSKGLKNLIIALVVLSATVGVIFAILIFSRRRITPSSHFLDEERGSQRRGFSALSSKELDFHNKYKNKDFQDDISYQSSGPVDIKLFQKYPPSDFSQSLNENEFANRLNSGRLRPLPFSLPDLKAATGNFASGRLLGEGSIGRVYRAKYPEGKVMAVKKIDSSLFDKSHPEEFSDIIASIAKFHHPNIAELVGFCSEQGHNIMVFEFYKNGSLHGFLHTSDEYSRPLTWNTRIRIALSTARAIEYLHEVSSPAIVHRNIKSSNILLDLDLNPHLCDYGLAIFHQRSNRDLESGYKPPECASQSSYTSKSDVYSFGVVMLELLTGRMPLDNSKNPAEQNLARWARPQLHDIDALARMVDPALRGLYPPKSLSQFADIIAMCIQVESEFRPPMADVVQELVRLVQRSSMSMKEDLANSRRIEDC